MVIEGRQQGMGRGEQRGRMGAPVLVATIKRKGKKKNLKEKNNISLSQVRELKRRD